MFTARAKIGIVVGAAIMAIGTASIFTSVGLQNVSEDIFVETGQTITYDPAAPAGSYQYAKIAGERFTLGVSTPGDGLQIPDGTAYEDGIELNWTHQEEGQSLVRITNTGSEELKVSVSFTVPTDPILFAYHFVVITAGVIVIGFSLSLSLRRPRGF